MKIGKIRFYGKVKMSMYILWFLVAALLYLLGIIFPPLHKVSDNYPRYKLHITYIRYPEDYLPGNFIQDWALEFIIYNLRNTIQNIVLK